MRKIKKIILGCMALACVAFAGAGIGMETSYVQAEEVAYESVDTSMFVTFGSENQAEGQFNISIVLPQYDYTGTPNAWYSFGDKQIAPIFEELGFFDNIMIGEKTLREWGCTSFFSNSVGYGEYEPQNHMIFRCQADPVLWNEAISSGELTIPKYDVSTGLMGDGASVTIKEGTVIPGYTYLMGTSKLVYRAATTYVASPGQYSYSWLTIGKTDIDSIKYVTGWDENYNNAYIGVSLKGDDFLGDGSVLEIDQNCKHPFTANPNMFENSILVNGEEDMVRLYGLYNHGEGGAGHYSFVINVKKEDCVSITIPKGTLFPARAVREMKSINAAYAHIWYETQTDKTFYMMNGTLLTYADYAALQLEEYKAEEGYFRAEEAAQRAQIVATASVAIKASATEDEANALLEQAKAAIDALKTAAQYADEELADDKADARAEVEAYCADVTYLAEEAAERLAAMEAGLAGIAAAKNVEEIAEAVATAKAAMDELPAKAMVIDLAKAVLDAYKAEVEYRDQEAAIRAEAISTAKTAIDNATTHAAVNEAVETAKATIDELKSAAEYVDQALETKRAEISTAVNTEKAKLDYDLYTTEDQAKINQLYNDAKSVIATAESEEEMNTALQTFKTEIAKLEQLKKMDATGCKASIGGASAVVGLIAMLGAVLMKRKEN